MNGNLVVSRREGRAVYIGRDVVITVMEIGVDERGRPTVQLAIEAPQDMAVSRDDYPRAVHMEFQKAREDGRRITEDQAFNAVRRRRFERERR